MTTVVVNGKEYGKGEFGNKKTSKQIAAFNTLQELAPHLNCNFTINSTDSTKKEDISTTDILIDDPVILTLHFAKTPVQIIQEYCTKYHKQIFFHSEVVADSSAKDYFRVVAKLDDLTAEVIYFFIMNFNNVIYRVCIQQNKKLNNWHVRNY